VTPDEPLGLFHGGGSAALPPPGASLWEIPTLWYEKPEAPQYLRAALEEVGLQVIAFTGYLVASPPSTVASTPNPVPIWGKLALRPWGLTWDADDWTTNFRGHATSGTIYYLFARGNRLTVLQSMLYTAASALAWELAEFHEPASLNDLIMTPFAGMAVGEALTQLGAFLDRSQPTLFNRAMAWVLTPPKKLHDWIDGAESRRDPLDPGWHRFEFAASAGLVRQGGRPSDWGARLAFRTEIFRAQGYGTTGRASLRMPDAVQSSLSLDLGFAGGEIFDVEFGTRFAAWGWYGKEIEGERDALRGHDLFAAFTFGLDYFEHDWFRGQPARLDQMEAVQLLAGTVQVRLFHDPWRLDLRLDAAGEFGGVRPFPFSLGTALPVNTVMPNVTYAQDYYFGIGLMLGPRLEAWLGNLALGGSWRVDAFTALQGRNLAPQPGVPTVMQDRRSAGRAWARWRFPTQGVELALSATRLVRWGRVDGAELRQGETDFWATVAVVF